MLLRRTGSLAHTLDQASACLSSLSMP